MLCAVGTIACFSDSVLISGPRVVEASWEAVGHTDIHTRCGSVPDSLDLCCISAVTFLPRLWARECLSNWSPPAGQGCCSFGDLAAETRELVLGEPSLRLHR